MSQPEPTQAIYKKALFGDNKLTPSQETNVNNAPVNFLKTAADQKINAVNLPVAGISLQQTPIQNRLQPVQQNVIPQRKVSFSEANKSAGKNTTFMWNGKSYATWNPVTGKKLTDTNNRSTQPVSRQTTNSQPVNRTPITFNKPTTVTLNTPNLRQGVVSNTPFKNMGTIYGGQTSRTQQTSRPVQTGYNSIKQSQQPVTQSVTQSGYYSNGKPKQKESDYYTDENGKRRYRGHNIFLYMMDKANNPKKSRMEQGGQVLNDFSKYLITLSGAESEEELQEFIKTTGEDKLKEIYNEWKKSKKVKMAKQGTKLEYILQLQGKCPEGTEPKKFMKGGVICTSCQKKADSSNKMKESDRIKSEIKACGGSLKKKQAGGKVAPSDTVHVGKEVINLTDKKLPYKKLDKKTYTKMSLKDKVKVDQKLDGKK